MVVTQNGDLDKNALKLKVAEQAKALGVPASAADMVSGFLDENGFFENLAQTVRQNGEFFGVYRSMGQGGIPWAVLTAFAGSAHAGSVRDQARTLAQLRQLGPQNVAMVREPPARRVRSTPATGGSAATHIRCWATMMRHRV